MPIDYGYGVSFDTVESAARARYWRNQRSVFDNCRQIGLITEKNHEKWLDTVQNNDRDHMFSIYRKSTAGYASGVAGVTYINWQHRTGELSLYLSPNAEGDLPSGTAIIKTLCAYAFEDLGLNRVFGETFERNTAALLNLKECGFVTEGTLRETYYKNGAFINSVIQSLLRSDYERVKTSWKQ